MTRQDRLRVLVPPLIFVVLAVSLTWISAAAFANIEPAPGASRLLRASLVYAAIVGWQPLVAFVLVRWLCDRARTGDYGLRPAPTRSTVLSIAIAISVLLAAVAVDSCTHGTQAAIVDVSWVRWITSVSALGVVIAVLWLQAIAEELAWRGYLLSRLMRGLRPWPGLLVHGALWGLCYAPVFVVAGGVDSLGRVASFVVTCSLLGVVLGWLRLASGSIYASAASNATLTLCAGLPLVLQGASTSLTAAFEPAGWLPLLAVILLFASRPSWRSAIVVPTPPLADHLN